MTSSKEQFQQAINQNLGTSNNGPKTFTNENFQQVGVPNKSQDNFPQSGPGRNLNQSVSNSTFSQPENNINYQHQTNNPNPNGNMDNTNLINQLWQQNQALIARNNQLSAAQMMNPIGGAPNPMFYGGAQLGYYPVNNSELEMGLGPLGLLTNRNSPVLSSLGLTGQNNIQHNKPIYQPIVYQPYILSPVGNHQQNYSYYPETSNYMNFNNPYLMGNPYQPYFTPSLNQPTFYQQPPYNPPIAPSLNPAPSSEYVNNSNNNHQPPAQRADNHYAIMKPKIMESSNLNASVPNSGVDSQFADNEFVMENLNDGMMNTNEMEIDNNLDNYGSEFDNDATTFAEPSYNDSTNNEFGLNNDMEFGYDANNLYADQQPATLASEEDINHEKRKLSKFAIFVIVFAVLLLLAIIVVVILYFNLQVVQNEINSWFGITKTFKPWF